MIRLGRGEETLTRAMKDLNLGWEVTGQAWKDKARRDFQGQYVDVFVPAVKAAISAMKKTAELLGEAIRECS
ncbi:MAG: hypothetical protein ACYTGB_07670 [Planctomycetota bacterium]|jgi:hypothetical protein